MRRYAMALVLAWATAATAQNAPLSRAHLQEMLPADSVIRPLGVRPQWVNRSGPGVYWKRASPTGVDAPYYALHFTGFRDDTDGVDWKLQIKGPDDTVLLSIGPADQKSGDFWTKDLRASSLVFVVEADRKPVGLTFTIDRWLIADPKPAIRSIISPGDSKLEPISAFRTDPTVWTPSRAVAKLSIIIGDKRVACTGFLIGQSLLMTNEHCMPAALTAPHATCRGIIDALFAYDDDAATPTTFECDQVLSTNVGLDYAVLQLKGTPGQSWGTLRLEDQRSPKGGDSGEPLVVIQHPGGRPTAVARQRCRADAVGVPGVETGGADQDFNHICDTEGGSSGSPVLDGSGRVIGLHHFGFENDAVHRRNQAVLARRIVASLPADVKAGLTP